MARTRLDQGQQHDQGHERWPALAVLPVDDLRS
jgi:hypothetical protein